MTTESSLQEMLGGVLQGEVEGCSTETQSHGEMKISIKVDTWAI